MILYICRVNVSTKAGPQSQKATELALIHGSHQVFRHHQLSKNIQNRTFSAENRLKVKGSKIRDELYLFTQQFCNGIVRGYQEMMLVHGNQRRQYRLHAVVAI